MFDPGDDMEDVTELVGRRARSYFSQSGEFFHDFRAL